MCVWDGWEMVKREKSVKLAACCFGRLPRTENTIPLMRHAHTQKLIERERELWTSERGSLGTFILFTHTYSHWCTIITIQITTSQTVAQTTQLTHTDASTTNSPNGEKLRMDGCEWNKQSVDSYVGACVCVRVLGCLHNFNWIRKYSAK